MKKYWKLMMFLKGRDEPRVTVSFEELSERADLALPASAYRYPAWWANDAAHHVQARAWEKAGYMTADVDIAAQKVTFVRVADEPKATGVRELTESSFEHQSPEGPDMHPAFGWLKGTFSIEPGYDLTQPSLDPEEMVAWEARLEAKAKLIEAGLKRRK